MSEQYMGARHSQDQDLEVPTVQAQFEPITYADQPYAGQPYADDQYAGQPYAADQYVDDQYAGDQYADDQYAEPYVAPAQAPKSPKKPLIPILIGAGAVVVVFAIALGVIFGYVLPKRAMDASLASFDTAAQAYMEAQTELSTQISAAQAVSNSVTVDELADPTTLDALATQITAAQALVAPAPMPAATAAEVDQQTADMVTKTKPASDAAAALATAVAAVQQSRIDLAVSVLSDDTQAAQSVYDESGWIDDADTTVRTDLMAQLNAAFLAIADPSSLGDNPDAILAALAQLEASLADAVAAVNAAEKSATTATYTYVLLADGGQAICGVNLCPGATTLVSVVVTVKNTTVTADITFTSGTGSQSTVSYKGVRKGTTAIVTPAKGGNAFQWGIVTFSGSDPNSPAIRFASADNCKRQNGSTGTLDANNTCQ